MRAVPCAPPGVSVKGMAQASASRASPPRGERQRVQVCTAPAPPPVYALIGWAMPPAVITCYLVDLHFLLRRLKKLLLPRGRWGAQQGRWSHSGARTASRAPASTWRASASRTPPVPAAPAPPPAAPRLAPPGAAPRRESSCSARSACDTPASGPAAPAAQHWDPRPPP